MLVIGVTGRARSGKNTVASGLMKAALKNNLVPQCFEISSYVLAELQATGEIDKWIKREELSLEDLSKLVRHGHERRRNNPWYWLNKLAEDVGKWKPDVAILPNIRFRNEADYIRYVYSGKIIRVKTLIKDGIEFISPDRNPNDPMEIENLSIDADFFLTVKRGQTDILKDQAATLFNNILKGTIN